MFIYQQKNIPLVSDFYPSIRRYILLSVSLTFQKISETLLASYLHLPPAEFEAMIKEKSQKEGWRRVPTPKEAIICLPKKYPKIPSLNV